MKLSKKGGDKIGEFLCGIQYRRVVAPLAFEPDDFEDCVVLTTKEAKVVNRALAFGLAVSESLRDQDDFEDLAEKIDKRIEQAEKENADN